MQFVDCILQFLIALFNNINVISKSEVVHSITMNMNTSLFSLFLILFYPIILSRNKANDRGDNGSTPSCILSTVIWNHSLRCPL